MGYRPIEDGVECSFGLSSDSGVEGLDGSVRPASAAERRAFEAVFFIVGIRFGALKAAP